MSLPNAKIKYYPNGVQRVTVFNYARFREVEREKIENPDSYDMEAPSRADSIKRAKDTIFDIPLFPIILPCFTVSPSLTDTSLKL